LPHEIGFAKVGYYNPNTGSDKFSGARGVDFHLRQQKPMTILQESFRCPDRTELNQPAMSFPIARGLG